MGRGKERADRKTGRELELLENAENITIPGPDGLESEENLPDYDKKLDQFLHGTGIA